MSEVVDFLNKAKVFYLATLDNGKPRVRPFGFVMDYEENVYFCTANTKDVYTQMVANPNVEISAMLPEGQWIRITGKAVFENNLEAKKKSFEIMPALAGSYKSPENPAYEVFYLTEGEATLYSFTEAPKKIAF